MNRRRTALEYARRGLHVLPLAGKRPHRMLGSEGGYKHATRDEATITSWWTDAPEAGIGAALVASGLVAFDAEGASKGGSPGVVVRELRKAYGFGDTWASVTPSGGTHVLLRWPPDAPPCPTRLPVHDTLAPLGLDLVKRSGHLTLPATLGTYPDPAGRAWALPPEGRPALAPAALVAEAVAEAARLERMKAQAPPPRPYAGHDGAPWTPRGRAYLTAAHARCMAAEQGSRHDALRAFAVACVRAMRAGEVEERHARALVEHAGAQLMPDDLPDVAALVRTTFENPDRFTPLHDRPERNTR